MNREEMRASQAETRARSRCSWIPREYESAAGKVSRTSDGAVYLRDPKTGSLRRVKMKRVPEAAVGGGS